MCTSMHVPCNSLRGSMVKGSLASLVGQTLWGGERGVVSKNHGRSSGSHSCPGTFYPEQCPCSQHTRPKAAVLTTVSVLVSISSSCLSQVRQNWRIFHSPLPPSEVGFGQEPQRPWLKLHSNLQTF